MGLDWRHQRRLLYRFHWRGIVDNVPTKGGGRGTSVLRREARGWLIVHEHLSAEPD